MKGERLADGRDRVVRHGLGPVREIQTGIGPVEVQRMKLRDRGAEAGNERIRFTSALLPPLSVHARFGKALLPAPDHRAVDAELGRHKQNRIARHRCENHAGTLRMLRWSVAIRGGCFEARSIQGAHDHADRLCHATWSAHIPAGVNQPNGSKH